MSAGHFVAAEHYGVVELSGLDRVGTSGQFSGKTVYGSTSVFNELASGGSETLPNRCDTPQFLSLDILDYY